MESAGRCTDHRHVLDDEELEAWRADIATGGFTVAAILADSTECDWAYSIGLHHSFGVPELLVVGLDAPVAGAVIEVIGNQVAAGRRLEHGDEVPIDGGIVFRASLVDDLWCSMGDWFVLGREVMAGWGLRWPPTIQLTWADEHGRFPERPGDPRWSLRQPLLSAR